MIKRPKDHMLHVTYQIHPFVLKSYMPQTHPSHHRYRLFFIPPYRCYNLISLLPTWLTISTSSFRNRSFTRRMWAKQAVCFDPWLTRKDYLQTNAFPNLVMVEQEEYSHALQRKATGGGVTSKLVKRRLAGRGQAWILGRQHQFLPGRLGGKVTLQYFAITMQR